VSACLRRERTGALEQRVQVLAEELAHLLLGATGVARRIELGQERLGGHVPERRIGGKVVEQIVRHAAAHRVGHRQAMPSDDLVQ
jgi:hypothetical protein